MEYSAFMEHLRKTKDRPIVLTVKCRGCDRYYKEKRLHKYKPAELDELGRPDILVRGTTALFFLTPSAAPFIETVRKSNKYKIVLAFSVPEKFAEKRTIVVSTKTCKTCDGRSTPPKPTPAPGGATVER